MRGTFLPRTLPWAAGALGLAVAALAAAYAVETASLATAEPMTALPLAAAYEALSTRSIDSDPARAATFARSALELRPVDARAWLNLAILDTRAMKRLTPTARVALQHSYDVAPYEPELIADRLALDYDEWLELPADMREEAASEMRAAFPKQSKQLFAAAIHARTPRARMALAMALLRMRVMDQMARSSPTPTPPPASLTP